MIDIAKKKLPSVAVTIVLYLSYCATSWYVSRGSIAYAGERYGMPGWFANDIWAFFVGGLVPVVIYKMASMFALTTLRARVQGDMRSLMYGLDLTIIAANLVLFGLKFIYFAVPMASGIMETFLDPVVTIGAVSLYLLYAFKMNYVTKPTFRFAMTQILSMFVMIYGVVTLFGLVVSVV